MSRQYTMLLDDEAAKIVERLSEAYRLDTIAEAYALGIALLRWATDHAAAGNEIGHYSDGDFTPVTMPHALDATAWKKVIQ